ncbi:prepilin peptidase [Massilia sp. CCM 8692]|uniref:Prepilin peptidase n=2 Tax=Massilia rubra TaxID=2607910 RepID=A0ABX0LLN5_9BURK|nr:prepilin peptidase [Massilia rubra]
MTFVLVRAPKSGLPSHAGQDIRPIRSRVRLNILVSPITQTPPRLADSRQHHRPVTMNDTALFFELLGMLVTDPRTGVLLALLMAAAVCDYRTFRIPNLITFGGIGFALVYNSIVPPVWHAGWAWAPAGMLLGFCAMLPMYAMGVMGAGDVKLMAMVGAFLGFHATLQALLFCVLSAGIAALAFGLRKRVMGRLLANTGAAMRGMFWSAIASGKPQLAPGAMPSVGKLAYGISIAIGTTACLVAQQFNLV